MRYCNLALPPIFFPRLLISSLHLNKSSPNPIPRLQRTLSSSKSNPNPVFQPSLCTLRTPQNNYSCLQSNSPISTNSHFKSYQPQDALNVLDQFPHPIKPISRNISKLASTPQTSNQSYHLDSTIKTFKIIRATGSCPDHFTYVNVISACTALQHFNFADQFPPLVVKVGFLLNGYVLSAIIDLFCKGGSFCNALDVFLYTCIDNVVCWNAIISGAVRNGETLIALKLFDQMVGGVCVPNGFTFSSVLSACTAIRELDIGRGLHAWVLKLNEQEDIFVGTGIVDLYAKCGDMDAAVKVFSSMPVRNVVSWTALISGFSQKEDGFSTLKFFVEMMRSTMDINVYTITSVLFACGKCFMASMSYQIHCWIFKSGLYSYPVAHDALISTYGRIGDIQMSEKVFEDGVTLLHLGNWSAMIFSLIQNQDFGRSIGLYLRMMHEDLKPDKSCISSILSIVDFISFGEQLHTHIVKIGLVDDLLVCSALFTMYSKCGGIGDSYELFRQMPEKDRVAWTSMISGFANHGDSNEAFQLLREMILEGIEPDDMTLSGALGACTIQKDLENGKEIHGFSFRHGLNGATHFGSSLISMYSRCNSIKSAKRVFAHTEYKDQNLWSSVISGYSTNNKSEETIFYFHQMARTGLEIDHITSSSVLGACAQLSKPILGRQLHGHAIKAGLILHNSVAGALVTLYSKCGIISESQKLFDGIQNPDSVTWTAMIRGYAQHGRAKEALETFNMMNNNGIEPDCITFVSILSACSHNGLVDEGFYYFKSMINDYGIEPEMRHYSCMVDLLGRAGRLKEAVDLIDGMLTEPGLMVWSTLLSACRVYGDVEVGVISKKKVLELESHDTGAHITASNMSADMGDWEQVRQIRSSMKGFGMKKEPGWSAL